LIGYGTAAAAWDLLEVYRSWAELLMPGGEAFEAEIMPAGEAPDAVPDGWIEQRGGVTIIWRLRKPFFFEKKNQKTLGLSQIR
jgi:hypothetical protein